MSIAVVRLVTTVTVRAGLRLPLDFISCVQTCTSSWISSGATSLRDQASSHRGRGAGSLLASALDPDLEGSFDLKTFLKNGMLDGREQPQSATPALAVGK
jgi:hypothetical protein